MSVRRIKSRYNFTIKTKIIILHSDISFNLNFNESYSNYFNIKYNQKIIANKKEDK